MAIKVLKMYGTHGRGAEMRLRIERARQWLLEAKPVITEDYAMRLAGVAVAEGSPAERSRMAEPILNRQHADGGWAQRDELASDAYATGMTLTLLAESGILDPRDAAFRKGVELPARDPGGRPPTPWPWQYRAVYVREPVLAGFPYNHFLY